MSDKIDLDELRSVCYKTIFLIEDPQPGLISWNEFMHERLQQLYNLASKALGYDKSGGSKHMKIG